MAKKERTPLAKNNWVQNFNLVGEVKLNDYTFKLDEKSEKSDWVYNSLNLGVNCGEKYGTVFAELMGGYGSERQNVVYVHGKDENGRDDFQNSYPIDWDDRFTESILENVGDLCFLTIGVEKTSQEKTYYKKFITPYDFIAYAAEHLEDGMVVNVRGQLKYTVYNGNIQCRKEINSIALSSATPDKYRATFTQTMLLDRDSVTKDSIDKDKGVINVDAYVLEKFKEYNGWDLTNGGKTKGLFVPLHKNFEYEINPEKPELTTAVINKLFKVKRGVTQITWDGEFVESGATITATLDDLTADIRELIDLGLYTEEEALAKCTVGGSKEKRMILKKPAIKMVGDDDDSKVPQIQRFEEAFTEEDMQLECLVAKETDDEEDTDEVPFEEETTEAETTVDEDDELQALLNALD